jgi:acetyl esterase/lipase
MAVRTDFGGGSLRSQLVRLGLRFTAKPVISAWAHAPRLPWPYGLVDYLGLTQRMVPGTTIEEVRLSHCRADVFRAPASSENRVVVYFHGGAFLVGGRYLHRGLISRIAEATGATVISIDYRQLPKHPISTSVEDCVEGYRYALSLGTDPADIVLMGDSAGGYLTFVVADRIGEEGLPAPAALVAMSPLADLDLERTPLDAHPRGCDLFPSHFKEPFQAIAKRAEGGWLPHAPVACSLGHLPPVLIQTTTTESLYAHCCALAEQLEAAGASVELQVWDKQVHVFQAGRPLPEAQQAIAEIAAYVEQVAPAVRRKTA